MSKSGFIRPTHQHIYLQYWPSSEKDGLICGDKTDYVYVSDEVYKSLPKCPICFRDKSIIVSEQTDGEEKVEALGYHKKKDPMTHNKLVLGRFL